MTDFPDYQEPQATATAIGATSLVGTGLAREAGGNLDTHTRLLSGTQAGALIANTGLTVAQETAALIASGLATGTPGGTPLLHGAKSVYTLSSQVIAAGGSFNTGDITITKPGYLIRVVAQMSGIGAVQPTVQCDLLWKVSATGSTATAEEFWFVPAGGTSAQRTTGKGPTKGDRVNITFTNGDLTDTVTLTVNIWETTQHIAREDWRSTAAVGSAAGGGIGSVMAANMVATDSFTVGAGATVTKNLPLYCGQVNIFTNQNAAAGSQITIQPGSMFTAAFIFNTVVIDWTQALHITTNVALPRAYCQLIAFNNGAAAIACAITITALEYAS